MITENELARIEHLRSRMLQRDITVQEVWEFLILQHQPNPGMLAQPPSLFITESDLKHFWSLRDWWDPVPNKPTALPTPAIVQFCWYVNNAPGASAVKFMDALVIFYNRAMVHANSVGLDVNNLREAADERKKRRNRERMAAVRGHRRVPDKDIRGNETLRAHVRSLEAETELIKEQATARDNILKDVVIEHQQRMIGASEQRKTEAAQFKTRIENLRTEIRALTAKQ